MKKGKIILLVIIALLTGQILTSKAYATTIFNDTFNPNTTPEDLEVYDSHYEPFTSNTNEISTYSNKAIVTSATTEPFYIKTDLSILGQKSLAISFTPSSASAASSFIHIGWDADPGIIADTPAWVHSGGYIAVLDWNYEKLAEVDIFKNHTNGTSGEYLRQNILGIDTFDTSTYIIQISNDVDGNIVISVNGIPQASVHDTDYNTGYFWFGFVQGTMNSIAITDYTSAEVPILCQPLDILCNLKTLFVPTTSSFTSSYSTLQTAFNTHAPFAYVSVIGSLDFSATNTATATPILNLPMESEATISAPYHIKPGTSALAWTDTDGNFKKLGTFTKPIFTIGLWLLLIGVVIIITPKLIL